MRSNRWNPYEGYPWGYLVVGILVFSSMVIMVAVVAIFPQYMTQSVDESNIYNNVDEKDKEKLNLLLNLKNKENKEENIKNDQQENIENDQKEITQERQNKQYMEEIYHSYDDSGDNVNDNKNENNNKYKNNEIELEEVK
eukprot:220485_1